MYKIKSNEWMYLAGALGIMFLLGILINVKSINNFVSNLSPIIQFIILNLGIYFIFFVVFRFITSNRLSWKPSMASFLMFLSTDLILPEYHVTISGLIEGGIFGKSATDYFFGFVYSLFGVSGFWLWLLVYPVTFAVIFIIGAFLFRDFMVQVE